MNAMKRLVACCAVTLSAGLALATPEISLTETVQTGPNKVNVSYVLAGSPALVTVTFETNCVVGSETVWAPIGKGIVQTLVGDVNRVVQPGARAFTWKARKDWPDREFASGSVRAVVKARRLSDPPEFAVIDLEKSEDAISYYETKDELPGGIADDAYKTTKLLLRRIRAANVRWKMGANYTDGSWDGKTVAQRPHMVSLSQDYYIGVYEFTQRQYELVAGFEGSTISNAKPSANTKGLVNADKRPLTNVSYETLRGSGADYVWPQKGHDVSPTLCFGLLRARYGFQFDLPTCAQWEYAYRAGTDTAFFTGDEYSTSSNTRMKDYAWMLSNTTEDDDVDYSKSAVDNQPRTHVVGKKLPNPWDLYDIAGNAAEICLDWAISTDNAPSLEETVDPVGPTARSEVETYMFSRIWRGGSCVGGGMMGADGEHRATAVYTWNGTYNCMGFRICCPAVAH